MKISSKMKYAKKMMDLLHANHEEGIKTVKGHVLAEKLEISAPYFEQVVSILIANNRIKAVRGCKGGYAVVYDEVNPTSFADVILMFAPKFIEAEDQFLSVLAGNVLTDAAEYIWEL